MGKLAGIRRGGRRGSRFADAVSVGLSARKALAEAAPALTDSLFVELERVGGTVALSEAFGSSLADALVTQLTTASSPIQPAPEDAAIALHEAYGLALADALVVSASSRVALAEDMTGFADALAVSSSSGSRASRALNTVALNTRALN